MEYVMAVHHSEQQNIETAKHLWASGGKWLAALLAAAGLGYIGYAGYSSMSADNSRQAAQAAAQVNGDAAKLAALQQRYPRSAAAAQASLETAAALFQAGKADEAAAAYRWVLANSKATVFQAAAMQNLAAVYIQQKKYDDALSVLATPVDAAYRPLTDEAKGAVYAAQGKAKEAGEAYKAALDKLPEGSAARHSLQAKISQL